MKTDAEVRTNTRRPRAELKQLVLQGAIEILQTTDLVLSLETLSYVRVFEHLKDQHGVSVTRGSVHERIWSSVEEFRLDALLHALEEPVLIGYEAMERIMAEVLSTADLSSAEGRNQALVRITRDAMPLYESIDHQGEKWKVIGLQILASMPEHEPGPAMDLADRLHARGEYWEDRFVVSALPLFELLHLHVRPDLGLDQESALRTFVRWMTDLNVGQRLYQHGTRQQRPSISFRPPGGESEQWSSYGLASYAMLQHLFAASD